MGAFYLDGLCKCNQPELIMPTTVEILKARHHARALGVLEAIQRDLTATMDNMEHLINTVPTGANRNAITEVNIQLGQLRVDLANIYKTMREQK